MIVLKFGGSSLKTVLRLCAVSEIIRKKRGKKNLLVVVSAVGGVTDLLFELVAKAVAGRRSDIQNLLGKIEKIHLDLAESIREEKRRKKFREFLDETLLHLKALLDSIAQLGESSDRLQDKIVGFGEILSAQLVSSFLSSTVEAFPWNGRELIVTDAIYGAANVLREPTEVRLRKAWEELKKGSVPVLTGYIGTTEEGVPTTLGRNGSDLTATVVGAALDAEEIQIYSDVDGILSADPKQVPEAYVLEEVSYAEATEMAYFGAEIIHPKTITPVKQKEIPIRILNTLNPNAKGTLIRRDGRISDKPVKAVTSISDVALLQLEGEGLLAVPGTAAHLFQALAAEEINVMMISQGSSEHSICFTVPAADGERARKAVSNAFQMAIDRGDVQGVSLHPDTAMVAVIGEGMQGTPGIAGRLFSVLGKNRVNVLAIAQGSSEMNITLVVAKSDCVKALNIIHGAFHLSKGRIHLFLIGKGTIGSKLLEQLEENRERILKEEGLDIRWVGLADSKKIWIDPAGIPFKSWERRFQKRGCPHGGLKKILRIFREIPLENRIVVDVTASLDVARSYPEILDGGMHLVTPNKKANTDKLSFYRALKNRTRRQNSYYLYETCVGAGLPVISTLQNLLHSGDVLLEIQGILSGTLSYLFAEMEKGIGLQSAVKAAMRLGFTEPDPREDLNGLDVARKILTLAREAGHPLELQQVKVENLVPPALRKGSVARFVAGLKKEEPRYAKKIGEAMKRGKRLRYVAAMKKGICTVGTRLVDRDSPLADLKPGDNVVIFKTRRYFNNPLIIKGPGAGPDVTAGGVFADILKMAHWLTLER